MQKHFSVRRAKARDLDRILQIEIAAFGPDAYDRKLFAEYTRNCGDLFLVAEGGAGADAKVYGYAITCLCASTGRRAELVSLALDPAVLGQGAASDLMHSILRRLKLRGVERLGLTVKVTNHRALAFYKKFGFHKLRRAPRYYEDGADGLLLARDL
jgi:ribosomal-protein-alanine N-acetyltransferase